MATEKQITANRANALHSTGPITPEGKKVASRNSTRHGMLAQTVVLEGESQSRFQDLLDQFNTQLNPRTPAEAAIVETMTIARWKQMRIWGIEKAGFQVEMARETSGAPAIRGYLTFKRLGDNSRVLDLQQRYETGYERQFCRAYSFLLKIRGKPKIQPDDPLLLFMPLSSSTATWQSPAEAAAAEANETNEAIEDGEIGGYETRGILPAAEEMAPEETWSGNEGSGTLPIQNDASETLSAEAVDRQTDADGANLASKMPTGVFKRNDRSNAQAVSRLEPNSAGAKPQPLATSPRTQGNEPANRASGQPPTARPQSRARKRPRRS